jgi:hypothetical protein
MNQSLLYRSISRVTGDSIELIRQVGFTVLTPPISESDEADRWLRNHRTRSCKHSRRQQHQPIRACIAV